MPAPRMVDSRRRLRWRDVYREAELYKSALRVYTKPLFQWRKALNVSTDGKTLYELASHGLRSLEAIHRNLQREQFCFRPAMGLKYNFNGKRRTLYIPPWEERIVDLLLYRTLNQYLHHWFSSNSYAYRDRTVGLDVCQSRIARFLRVCSKPIYLSKRDISDFFASVNHEILLQQLSEHIEPGDYLYELVCQRVCFLYHDEEGSHQAGIGIPFGCASACVLANIYLTEFDRLIEKIDAIRYFRYSDDMLLLSQDREAALRAAEFLEAGLAALHLSTKPSQRADLVLGSKIDADACFTLTNHVRHLGLLFHVDGDVSLSRDKRRKIQNLFRFAFRRSRRSWRKITNPEERARTLCAIAAWTAEKGVRNVAVLDYYLKHVTHTRQLELIDRWLAEEVLSLVFGGHKKGHFAKLSFAKLRSFGLPCLLHRHRLIVHGQMERAFFIWQRQKEARALKGTVARLACTERDEQPSLRAQKQQPIVPVREGGCL
jgi:retron-type reverse transcriptase